MSKKCADCGCEVNPNVIQGMYYCPRCDDDKTERDVLPLTVFDYITQSEEKLAEMLVYERVVIKNIQINDSDSSHNHGTYMKIWASALLPTKFFDDKEKAFEATIEELKKAVKDE